MKHSVIATILFALITTMAYSQKLSQENTALLPIEKHEKERRHFIGSSLFVSFNYFIDEPADFYQLSYGYNLSPKDVLFAEAVTWKYNEPLGTYDNSEVEYPGKVRAYGIGFGYQRFHWKNLFTSVVATPFMQQFYDEEDSKIQKGFQLYLQGVLGYRIEMFNKRFFIEPAYAIKYWPVNTNFPDAFAEIEKGKPKHIFEPSLNFGFRF